VRPWALVLVITTGCGGDVCAGVADCVRLVVDGDPAVGEIDQLRVSASGAIQVTDAPTPPTPLARPLRLPVQLALIGDAHASGALTLHVEGRRASATVGAGGATGSMSAGTIALTLLAVGESADLAVGDATLDLGASDDASREDASLVSDLTAVRDSGATDAVRGFAFCDVVTQTGCSAEQKCTIDVDGFACAPSGTVAAGQHCVFSDGGFDNCLRGAACIAAGSSGICAHYCAHDAECAALSTSVSDSVCVPPFCSNPCNPVASQGPTGCPATGLSCIVFSNPNPTQITSCVPTSGTAGDGESCTTSFDCQGGLNLSCASHRCRRACRIHTPADCNPGEICGTPVGETIWGFCCPSTGC
jgi:hypothetical protein